jgi:hypothetical protein
MIFFRVYLSLIRLEFICNILSVCIIINLSLNVFSIYFIYSELPDDHKKVLLMRFNDIDDLSVLFTKIDDKLMSSSDEVEAYVKNNPDTNKNNDLVNLSVSH